MGQKMEAAEAAQPPLIRQDKHASLLRSLYSIRLSLCMPGCVPHEVYADWEDHNERAFRILSNKKMQT